MRSNGASWASQTCLPPDWVNHWCHHALDCLGCLRINSGASGTGPPESLRPQATVSMYCCQLRSYKCLTPHGLGFGSHVWLHLCTVMAAPMLWPCGWAYAELLASRMFSNAPFGYHRNSAASIITDWTLRKWQCKSAAFHANTAEGAVNFRLRRLTFGIRCRTIDWSISAGCGRCLLELCSMVTEVITVCWRRLGTGSNRLGSADWLRDHSIGVTSRTILKTGLAQVRIDSGKMFRTFEPTELQRSAGLAWLSHQPSATSECSACWSFVWNHAKWPGPLALIWFTPRSPLRLVALVLLYRISFRSCFACRIPNGAAKANFIWRLHLGSIGTCYRSQWKNASDRISLHRWD